MCERRSSIKNSGKKERLSEGPGDEAVHVTVDPGICGFQCRITARKAGRSAALKIRSDCVQIKDLASNLKALSLKDLFVPYGRNPLFRCAESAGCHNACPVPSALFKAAEVALGLALPKNVSMSFQAAPLSKGRAEG